MCPFKLLQYVSISYAAFSQQQLTANFLLLRRHLHLLFQFKINSQKANNLGDHLEGLSVTGRIILK